MCARRPAALPSGADAQAIRRLGVGNGEHQHGWNVRDLFLIGRV
jgi:hypothetical protein